MILVRGRGRGGPRSSSPVSRAPRVLYVSPAPPPWPFPAMNRGGARAYIRGAAGSQVSRRPTSGHWTVVYRCHGGGADGEGELVPPFLSPTLPFCPAFSGRLLRLFSGIPRSGSRASVHTAWKWSFSRCSRRLCIPESNACLLRQFVLCENAISSHSRKIFLIQSQIRFLLKTVLKIPFKILKRWQTS